MTRRRTALFLVATVVVAAALAGWLRFLAPRPHPPGLALTDVRSAADLQARFNADRGTTRLVVILSPT